ncbi:hypothetical protein TorRG33x02_111440 [Trema orientale]|uniref:Uncharacterized protein n=1 Tax=Trema orientale TaxID=63057 RepID=A0A2P5F622_TREOI|nr:hypothetical protein TorRG33x02_111440 [Trema orientale]
MGNRFSRTSSSAAVPYPATYDLTLYEGHYYYPSPPNKGYSYGSEAPAPSPPPQNRRPLALPPPAVMNCDVAAERYGGFVISEYR